MAAISVAAITSRLDAGRRRQVAAELQQHAQRLGRLLDGTIAAAGAPKA
jgi:DNA-binding IclR family transcriptional regulator